jgi:hypothetical protein
MKSQKNNSKEGCKDEYQIKEDIYKYLNKFKKNTSK